MKLPYIDSRFNLGSRPPTASSSPLFERTRNRRKCGPLFPTVSPSKRCLWPAEAFHASLFAFFVPQERKIRAFVFNHLRTLFHSAKEPRHLASFQSLGHSLQEYRGVGRAKIPSSVSLRQRREPSGTKRTNCPASELETGRCSLLTIFLFRHILTSAAPRRKPYPTPYHLMAKRYRTHPRSVGVYSGFRVVVDALA